MIQPTLFGDTPARPRDVRETYRRLHIRDLSPGCCDCEHCDWIGERCRLTRARIDVDFGACDALERRRA